MKLHRSLIFWAGLVVMSFLLWAWRDSTCATSTVRLKPFGLVSMSEGVYFFHRYKSDGGGRLEYNRSRDMSLNDARLKTGPPNLAFSYNSGSRDEEIKALMRLTRIRRGEETAVADYLIALNQGNGKRGDWFLFTPYWMVLSFMAALWGGGLAWRWRRVRKRA